MLLFLTVFFYKNSTIQSVTFISSKIVSFQKHLTYQVQDPQEKKFPLPLNGSYCCKTIKLAVGAMMEPLHT